MIFSVPGHPRRLVALLATSLFLAAPARADIAVEKVYFKVADAFEIGAAVSGELRIPDAQARRLPAVLILDSSPGADGRGVFYAEALNRAGIATFEIDMFQGRGIPASPRHNLPHAFESLQYLAGNPRIDPARIGIMGFSWGGMLSILSSSNELNQQYARHRPGFAAHLGLYPLCWRLRALLGGSDELLKPSVYQRATGKPVHILAGGRDGYDGPHGCRAFLDELPDPVRAQFSLTVYPEATFGWDSRFDSASYARAANQGKGGIVTVTADPAVATRSRDFAVDYFRKHLAAE